MALQAWISVKGAKQGQFKGEASIPARRDKWMAVLGFTMGLAAPRDAASGQATGRRQYQPVTVVKAWGAASPQGLTACATNEVLPEVAIEFTRQSATRQEVVYQTVRLTNASFSQIARFTGRPDGAEDTPSSGHTGTTDMMELERWAFTFQKIETHDNDGNTSFTDTWGVTA